MAKQYLKVGDVSKRTGVSIRSLHFYEEKGLLKPSHRSDSGYRLYSFDDLMQLQKIKSLQQIGLSLDEISEVVQQTDYDLSELLKSQVNHLKHQVEQHTQDIQRLEQIANMLDSNINPSIEVLIEAIKVTVMYEKYFTPNQFEELKKRNEALTEDEQNKIEKQWNDIFDGFRDLQSAGEPASCEKALLLAKQAHIMLDKFTGGDPELRKSLNTMYKQEGGAKVIQEHGAKMDEQLFGYMQEAMRLVDNKSQR